MAGVALFHSRLNRRKEKALGEIMDRADKSGNGRIFVSDFMEIMEENDIKVDDEEVAKIGEMANEDGDISKNDFIAFTKTSDFWKESLGAEYKPGARTTKVTFLTLVHSNLN